MSSWADALAQPRVAVQTADVHSDGQDMIVAVVDANAIISGADLQGVAARLVTVPEVLREVKDEQSRRRLALLPTALQSQEPSDESLRAGERDGCFFLAVDLHARLDARASGNKLELEASRLPVVAVMRFARASGDLQTLSTTDCKLLALAHTLEVAAHGSDHLRELPEQPRIVRKKLARGDKALPGWGVSSNKGWEPLDRLAEQEEPPAEGAGSPLAPALAVPQGESVSPCADGYDLAEDWTTGEGWEVAKKNSKSARRERRKEVRRAARAALVQPPMSAGQPPLAAMGDGVENVSSAGLRNEDMEDGSSDAGQEWGTSQSSVFCVTADFAMQNIILQMGLRLAAPDGRQICQLSCWVLRCSACFNVTKDVARLFCPKCGNATMERVEIVIGPDGAEQYGVRRNHVLRGTQFTLPKPKGGRHKDPILREDVLLQRMPMLRRVAGTLPASLSPIQAAQQLAGWKGGKNPNEREHQRTNRRRK